MNALIIALALSANALPAAGPTFDNLRMVIENNNIPVLYVLLQRNPNIWELDVETGTPLHYAIKKDNQEAVQALLNHALKKNLLYDTLQIENLDGHTPLAYADHLGHTNCAKLIRTYNNTMAIDYDEEGAHPLPTTAPENKLAPRSRALVSVTSKKTELHRAIIDNNPANVERLLTENKDLLLDQYDNKETPLHLAICQGSLECVQAILFYAQEQNILEAILSAQNAQGQTALHMAVIKKLKVIVADDETIKPTRYEVEDSRFAQEVISSATTSGTLSSIINIKNNKNETPLHWATQTRNDVCIRLLLAQDADTQTRNSMELRPVDLLRKREDADLIVLFKTQEKKQKEKCVIC